MGYTTDFSGQFFFDKPLTDAHREYLTKFAEVRHMWRDEATVLELHDPIRERVGLPIGKAGEFFVGGGGHAGQNRDPSIADYNSPPDTQPGLWCQWVPTEDGKCFEWNGMEKFYSYTEWLKYLLDNFLIPWGYTLQGRITWQGEDESDIGTLAVINNKVVSIPGQI